MSKSMRFDLPARIDKFISYLLAFGFRRTESLVIVPNLVDHAGRQVG
jgi:hypothetical protein